MPEELRVCQRCGAEFYSWQPAASHCSGACRQAVYRRRKSNAVTLSHAVVASTVEDMDMVRMLDAEDVADKLRCSRSHLNNVLANDPTFPRPRRLGRLIRWPEAAIDDWINGRGATVQSRPSPACETRVI